MHPVVYILTSWAQVDCAISFSWCGNIRSDRRRGYQSGYPAACSSLPNINVPAWTARAPRRRPARFALFDIFHRTKSIGLRLSSTTSTPRLPAAGRDPDATARHMSDRRYVKHHVAVVRHISVTFGDHCSVSSIISAIWCVARGSISGAECSKHQNLCAFRRSCDPPRHKAFAIFIGAFDDFVIDIGMLRTYFSL